MKNTDEQVSIALFFTFATKYLVKKKKNKLKARLKLLQLSLLQSGDEDDSENLAHVLKDLRDSEAKLVSMLGEAPEDKNIETNGDGETIKVKNCVVFVAFKSH